MVGEEIASGIGLRTTAQGFGAPASNRQGYGLTEKDSATGLNHTWFRKNENRAGRWTSPDPYNGSASVGNPQSWNRYSYVENEPTNFVDPSGLLVARCEWRMVVPVTCSLGEGGECGYEWARAGLAYVCTLEGGGGRRVPGDIVISGGGHYNPNRQKNVSSTKSDDCADIENNIYEILAVVLIRIEEYLKWADGKYNKAVSERQSQLRKQIEEFDKLKCSSNNPRMHEARKVATRTLPMFRKIPELNYVRPWVGPIPTLVPRVIFPTPMICIICSPEVIKKALETVPGGGGGFPDA